MNILVGKTIYFYGRFKLDAKIILFIRDENPTKVVLNFTHSGALLKFISHLQLYKDIEPLKHNNYSNDRKWRTSKIGGFGSNIIFVLYK